MRWRNSADEYGIIARSLHWFIAVAIFAQIGIGVHVDGLPFGIERLRWVSRHKSVGLLILAAFLLRLVWRSFDHAPPLPGVMNARERRLAASTHWLLYGLAMTAAVFGWLHASAAGLGASFFGLFPIPSLMPKNVELSKQFAVIHAGLVWTLAALIALHVGAALRHLWKRDGVFRRMFPLAAADKHPEEVT